MKWSDKRESVYPAFLAAHKAVGRHVTKDSDNPYHNSRFASLTAIMDLLTPELEKVQLEQVQEFRRSDDDNGIYCVTTYIHPSGEWVEFEPYFMAVEKRTGHGYGSITTFSRRYPLLGIWALCPEDDDGNAAEGLTKKKNDGEAKKKKAIADYKRDKAAKAAAKEEDRHDR